jgi:hypothetical protein
MPLDKNKLDELVKEGGEPDTTIEPDWLPVRDWPEELQILLLNISEADEVYEQLKKVPVDFPEYHVCMELLQAVRKETRRILALAILDLHDIELPDLPRKVQEEAHDSNVLGGGHPL